MSQFVKKLEQLNQNLIVLKHTKKINSEDLEFPEWYELSQDYKAVELAVHKALVSIKNSIITQRRVVFGFDRDSLRELVSNDKNHKQSVGLKNDNYKVIIKLGIEVGLFELVKKGEHKQVSIYKLTEKTLKSYLQISEDQQLTQALDFQKKFKKGDSKGDTVVSSKELVVSSKQLEKVLKSNQIAAQPQLDTSVELESEVINPNQVAAELSNLRTTALKFSESNNNTKQIASANSPIPLTPSLFEQASSVPISILTTFEREFLKDKTVTTKFSEKQQAILSRIIDKLPKSKINKELALKALTLKSAELIIEELNKYDLTQNKRSLANLLLASNMPYQHKKTIALHFNLPKPQNNQERSSIALEDLEG